MDRLETMNYLKDKPDTFFLALKEELKNNKEYSFKDTREGILIYWLDFSFLLKYQIVSPHKYISFKTYEIVDSETDLDLRQKKQIPEIDFTLKIVPDNGGICLVAFMNNNIEKRYRQDKPDPVSSFIELYTESFEKTIIKNYE